MSIKNKKLEPNKWYYVTTVKGGFIRGPIDYILLGVDGPKFDGSILSALATAIDSGAVALVALSVVAKILTA